MDTKTLCKWVTCVSAIVVVVLLALTLDKLSKKNTGEGRSQSNKNKERRMRIPGPQPQDQPSCGIVDSQPCLDDVGFAPRCCAMSECTEEPGAQPDPKCGTGSGRFPMKSAVLNGNCVCLRELPKGSGLDNAQCSMMCDSICTPDESGNSSPGCHSQCMSDCSN